MMRWDEFYLLNDQLKSDMDFAFWVSLNNTIQSEVTRLKSFHYRYPCNKFVFFQFQFIFSRYKSSLTIKNVFNKNNIFKASVCFRFRFYRKENNSISLVRVRWELIDFRNHAAIVPKCLSFWLVTYSFRQVRQRCSTLTFAWTDSFLAYFLQCSVMCSCWS